MYRARLFPVYEMLVSGRSSPAPLHQAQTGCLPIDAQPIGIRVSTYVLSWGLKGQLGSADGVCLEERRNMIRRNDTNAVRQGVKPTLILPRVVSDTIPRFDYDVRVNNRPADGCTASDDCSRQEHRMPHVGSRLQDNARRQYGTVYTSARDIDGMRNNRVHANFSPHIGK